MARLLHCWELLQVHPQLYMRCWKSSKDVSRIRLANGNRRLKKWFRRMACPCLKTRIFFRKSILQLRKHFNWTKKAQSKYDNTQSPLHQRSEERRVGKDSDTHNLTTQ